MKKHFASALILVLFVLVTGCNKGRITIVNKNFASEILPLSNLEFTFSEDMVPDSLVGNWSEVEYIKIEPKVQGKTKWINNRTLVFSPALGFAPSTNYEATFTAAVTKSVKSKNKLDESEKTQFHTTYFDLISTDLYWNKTDNVVELKTILNFNYVVEPIEISKQIEVYIDSKKTNFLLSSSIKSESIEISIPEAGNSYETKPIKIILKEGAKCLNSDYKTPSDIVKEQFIPSKSAFQITEITPEIQNQNNVINIHTNQSIEKNQLFENLIKIYNENDEQINGLNYDVYDFGIFVRGEFADSKNYRIVVSAELKGIFGGTLGKDVDMNINFSEQNPKLVFGSKSGIYLTSKGEKNIGIKAVNVKEFEVKIYKIYENNILHFLNNSSAIENYNYYEYDYDYYDEYSKSDYFYGDYDNYGKLISTSTVKTSSLAKNGNQYLLNLNLNDHEQQKGIYVVKIASNNDYYLNDTKILAFSDLGLIVKEDKEDVYVFVNSIVNTSAESGVKVELITKNNQTAAKATTNGKGVAVFKGIKNNLESDFKMILARKESDFTYLHLNQTSVDISRFDLGGELNNLSGYQLFVYAERDLYRPGETVNINTILRDETYNQLASFPLEVSVLTPLGNELKRIKGKTNGQGAFNTSFYISESNPTGLYTIEVYSANKSLLNSKNISIEEFMPDRISVKSTIDKTDAMPGQLVNLEANVNNLFGTPSAFRNYEVSFSINKKYISFNKFKDYNFELKSDLSSEIKNETREGKTTAMGTLHESFEIPAVLKNNGIFTAKTFTTVFDENGRPVNRINTFDIYSQNEFLGIGSFDSYVDIKQPINIPLASVDKLGNPRTSTARVDVVKYNWRTILQKTEYGEYRYQSQKQEQIVESKTIAITPNTVFRTVLNQSGEYGIRVRKTDAKNYVETEFYAYGYGFTSSSDFEVNQDGEVTIVADKEEYNLGDEAKLLFKTPFAGKLLVTVERNKVFEHHIIETDSKSASLTIEMKDEFLPNAFISATLLRPINANTNLPLTVAHGYLPIKVTNKAARIPITIEAAESSRSKTKQTIKVKTNGNKDIELTVAVVDEGILQIKNYKTPEPFEFFFRPRKLEVRSYDIYPRLFPELKISKANFGADGYNLGKRLNPLGNKRVKLVSFWSGHLHTNSSGEASYTVDIPQFSGDLRIMVAAYHNKSFGSAEKHMKVADPIVISSGIPRFMASNDKVIVPVTISNTTAKATQASVNFKTGQLLKIEGNVNQNITIAPNSEKRVYFSMIANPTIGVENISVSVKAMGETFTENTSLSIRPSAPLEKITTSGKLERGSMTLNSKIDEFIPSTVGGKIIIGRSPLIQFSEKLNNLLRYPYGCVEQTVSTAFPQIYFSDLCKAVDYKKGQSSNPNYNVQQAIEKLNTMQLYNGGMSYWQGGDYESWFGSIYAAHFLIEAQKAGYKTDNNVIEKLLEYISTKAKNKSTENYGYYTDESFSSITYKTIVSKEVIYSLYVLALKNYQDLPTMNYFKANPQLLSLDCKYLLASTFKLIGDNNSYQELLPASFSNEVTKRCNYGSFYSYIRDESLALNALINADINNPQVPKMANHISLQIKNNAWLSTQELAFSMLALGKLSKLDNSKPVSANVIVNGKTFVYDGSKANYTIECSRTKSIVINNTNAGNLYYYFENEGVNASSKVTERDNYLRVRRQFYTRNGALITSNKFKQNDLIVVKLTLENLESNTINNVVITDLLPSGFEIENARLTESEDLKWIENKSNYDYMDIRDDRINFFTDAYGTKTYYYLVRAVSPGTFVLGPVGADAMYNGDYNSYNGAGQIIIEEK